NGQTVWDGTVAVFDLRGHPSANRAYAWSYERPDGKRRFFAVLHAPPVASPRDAVRAAIVAEAKKNEVCQKCGGAGVLTEMHPARRFPPKAPPQQCDECNG